jgi:histone H3/H4
MPRPKQVARKLGGAPRKQLVLNTKNAKIAFDKFVKPHIATGGEEVQVTKKRRSRPGMKARRTSKKYLKGDKKLTTKLTLQHLPFERLVREITKDYMADVRFSADAILHLQDVAEQFLVGHVKKATKVAESYGAKSVSGHDIEVVRFSRKDW